MKKPNLITKFFAVGTSGPTIDGRTIKPKDIDDMAETYDPAEYTALINYEHFKFFGGLSNLGKVLALKTKTDAKGRRVLLAQLRPNSRLLQLNEDSQKLFTSMEIVPDFAKSGKAYLLGLAVTDSPASVGTEALCFSAHNDGPAPDKRFKDNYFTQNFETETFTMAKKDDKKDKNSSQDDDQNFNADPQTPASGDDKDGFLAKFKAIFEPSQAKNGDDFSALQTASLELAQKYADMAKTIETLEADNADLKKQFAAQAEEITKLTKLTATLEAAPEGDNPRPPASGESENLTDC
jgi:hypothetical protein